IEEWMLEAARATADYYIAVAAADGVPYWDTGAPGLAALGDWGGRPADPFNDVEPVDSSAAVIAAQGLLRLGSYLSGTAANGSRAARDISLCRAPPPRPWPPRRAASNVASTPTAGIRRSRPVAIVTGGTRGIGLGIARALATGGWDLALSGVRPEETVRDVVAA